MKSASTVRRVAVGLAAVAVLAACTSDDKKTGSQPTAASAATAPATTSPTATTDGTKASSAGVAATGSEPVLGQLDFSKEGSRFHVDIVELRQTSPEMLTLRWRATMTGPKDASSITTSYFGGVRANGIELVDEVGKKKYLVVTDTAGRCVCTSDRSALKVGEAEVLFAMYPAPPANVTSITVIFPTGGPVRDVPIAR